MPQSNKVQLKVVPKSSFPGKMHFNRGTAKVGSLVPILIDELIPNTTVDIKQALNVSLPPLASDTFMSVDYCVEAFFVPLRLLYRGFESWFTQRPQKTFRGVDVDEHTPNYVSINSDMPRIFIGSNSSIGINGIDALANPHNLFDYFSAFVVANASNGFYLNPLPFVAYSLVWDSWYRNTLVQQSAFAEVPRNGFDGIQTDDMDNPYFALMPNLVFPITDRTITFNDLGSHSDDTLENASMFADGVKFWELRQRNFGFDYFTNSWPLPQSGQAMSVSTDSDGKFTIASLRGANSLQQWEEKGLYCPRLIEACRVRYGAHLSDGVAQRPICLGSGRYNVYSRGVDVNAANANAGLGNPFAKTAGAQLAQARASGTEHIVDHFTAQEPGYLLILGSLVPKASYGSGVSRLMTRYTSPAGSRAEMADPELQNSGNQPIYQHELNGRMGLNSIFGYTDRFADWMTMRDEIHGLLRDGYSLESFALKRDFSLASTVQQGSAFLQIPTNFMDSVTATVGDLSNFGYWYEVGFNYKCSMPLQQYSIPSLQNPAYEHGNTITAHRGGFRF